MRHAHLPRPHCPSFLSHVKKQFRVITIMTILRRTSCERYFLIQPSEDSSSVNLILFPTNQNSNKILLAPPRGHKHPLRVRPHLVTPEAKTSAKYRQHHPGKDTGHTSSPGPTFAGSTVARGTPLRTRDLTPILATTLLQTTSFPALSG